MHRLTTAASLALLIAAAPGCAPDPPPRLAIDATLVAAAAIRHGPDGLRHRVTPGRAVVVRLDGDADRPDLALTLDGRPLPHARHRWGPHDFAIATPDAPTGELALTHRGRPLARWRLEATPPPDWLVARVEAAAAHLDAPAELAAAARGHGAAALLLHHAGRPTEGARALRRAAHLEGVRGGVTTARLYVELAESLDATVGHINGHAHSAYRRATLARRLGALDDADAALDDARQAARASFEPRLAGYVAVQQATLYGLVGHHPTALALFDLLALAAPGFDPDLAVLYHGNRGWAMLEALETGIDVEPAAIEAAFRAALARATLTPDRANQRANLAALAHVTRDRAALDEHLAAYDALDPDRALHDGLYVQLLDGQRALDDDDPATARARFEQITAAAEGDDVLGGYAWQARLGLARAHRLDGDLAAALTAYHEAHALLELGATRAALQRDRGAFFARRGAVYDEAFDAALDAGDLDAAFRFADARHARLLRDLESRTRLARLTPAERAAWQARVEQYVTRRHAFEQRRDARAGLARSQLAQWDAARAAERRHLRALFDETRAWLDRVAPISRGGATVADVRRQLDPDAALWLARPAERGWHGLLVTPTRTTHHRVDRPIPPPALIPPEVAHLVLVGVPPAAAAPLRARVSTAHVSHAGALRADPPAPARAPIVFGDPDQTLPGARAEAAALAAQLGAPLVTGAAADRAALRGALDRADLVHFSGHGVFAAPTPWDAHLRLAGRERLTLEDVLMARTAARLVVLSSCETGRALPVDDDIGLSLADAFVAAGARAVVAAWTPVPDGATGRLMARFYAAGGAERPAAALREATLALAAEGDPIGEMFQLWGAR